MTAPEPLEPLEEQPGKRIPDWKKIWHSGLDYVAPGYEMGSHPMERGGVSYVNVPPRKKKDGRASSH